MSEAPFYAKDFSTHAQVFLYACAFWTVAADEELKSTEQKWLKEQFGEDGATNSLDDFIALGSDDFFDAFYEASDKLTDEERTAVSRLPLSTHQEPILLEGAPIKPFI